MQRYGVYVVMHKDPKRGFVATTTKALSKVECKQRFPNMLIALTGKEFRDLVYKTQSNIFRDPVELDMLVKRALGLTKSSSRVKDILNMLGKHTKSILQGMSQTEVGMAQGGIDTFYIKYTDACQAK